MSPSIVPVLDGVSILIFSIRGSEPDIGGSRIPTSPSPVHIPGPLEPHIFGAAFATRCTVVPELPRQISPSVAYERTPSFQASLTRDPPFAACCWRANA